MPFLSLLHFIHTPEFDRSLGVVPMSDDELNVVQQALQVNSEAGKVIAGTGGVRKLRAAVKGKGKRGGARILYYYVSGPRTIYLLLAYDKSETGSISDAGKRLLKAMTKQLDEESK